VFSTITDSQGYQILQFEKIPAITTRSLMECKWFYTRQQQIMFITSRFSGRKIVDVMQIIEKRLKKIVRRTRKGKGIPQ
jgi:hypothetical protein